MTPDSQVGFFGAAFLLCGSLDASSLVFFVLFIFGLGSMPVVDYRLFSSLVGFCSSMPIPCVVVDL